MKKQYLIFPVQNDIYNYLSVTIEPEKLEEHLVEIEILEEGDTLKDMAWVVFEDGNMIQG